MHKQLFFSFLLACLTLFPLQINAKGEQKNGTSVVLTVQGKIAATTPLHFTLPALMKLGETSFIYTSKRSGKKIKYAGLDMREFLRHIKVQDDATMLEVVAENNYVSLIRLDQIQRYEYLLSYKKNDALYQELDLSENKGPLAIAINFDKYPELDWDIFKHQLVWFVKEINVK